MWQETILTQYSASQKLLDIIDTFNQAGNGANLLI